MRDCLPATAPTIATRFIMDRATNTLNAALKSASELPVNTSAHRGKPKLPWFNREIENLRRSSGKLFNRAKATDEWALYKAKNKELEYTVRRAKRAS